MRMGILSFLTPERIVCLLLLSLITNNVFNLSTFYYANYMNKCCGCGDINQASTIAIPTTTTTTESSNVRSTTNTNLLPVVKYAQDLDRASFVYNNDIDITLAACHKPLFGDADLYKIITWVSYHRLLGFDHFFIWYLPMITSHAGFDSLASLPYVTMVEHPNATVTIKEEDGSVHLDHFASGNQYQVLDQCINSVATNYSWVMHADSDEYMWFDNTKYTSFRHLLHQHDNMNYLSFGKYMYTMNYTVSVDPMQVYTGLEQYAFTTKSFCRPNRYWPIASTFCPTHHGRSKLIVRPKSFTQLTVHGNDFFYRKRLIPGHLHITTDQAHFKEWAKLFVQDHSHTHNNTNKHDLVLPEDSNLGIHEEDGVVHTHDTITMYYDHSLVSWMRYITLKYAAVPV